MALASSSGVHVSAPPHGANYPHTQTHSAAHMRGGYGLRRQLPCSLRHPPGLSAGGAVYGMTQRHALAHAFNPSSSTPSQSHSVTTTARRGGWSLARPSITSAFNAHREALRVGPSAGTLTSVTCRASVPIRLPPPAAASGAAPGGPSPPPQGAASAASHQFNPRYNQHRPAPQRHLAGNQQHPPHPHQSHHPHQHLSGTPSGRGPGAWTTSGPLAPGGGPQPGVNSRHDPHLTAPAPSLRPVPSPQPRPFSPEDSRLVAGAGALLSAPHSQSPPSPSSSGSAATTVAAAARQPPRPGPHGSGPSLPQQPRQGLPADVPRSPPSASLSQHPERRPQLSGECTRLERLYIRDFALVSEQTVRFGPGLNVITGESGSGKSVLVEAFSQVLGAPAPQECVRAPAEMAVIEGCFLVAVEQREAVRQLLASCGLPQQALSPLGVGDGDAAASSSSIDSGAAASGCADRDAFRLTVRREISQAPAGGLRSRVFLNGAATSLRVLRELGALLVDTNGQHSAMSLRDSATQLELLDRIAVTSPLADSYCSALARLRHVEGLLDELDELDDEEERATMQKLVDAVAKLRVRPGEERELRRALKKMEARRVAVEQCGLVRMALCGEAGAGGVTDALRTIEAQLNAILAQEEQNRAASAARRTRGKDGSRAADGDPSITAAAASAAGEDEAGEEGEEEEGEEGSGAAVGARMMEEALEQVAAAKDMLAEAENMVRAYARRYQFSQADHDATSERLARIERLMKQASAAGFGAGRGGRVGGSRISSTEQLLEVAEECSAKLAAYYEMEGQREEWEAQLEVLVEELRETALQLSARRRAAAAALRSAVESCLRELAMGGSRFDVRIGWAEERVAAGAAAQGLYVSEEEAEESGVAELGGRTYVAGPRGLDQVEFLLAAGPAEPLRPLAAVASGGESARVMLALKAAPAQAAAAAVAAAAAAAASGGGPGQPQEETPSSLAGGGVPIMILDELDSGIGARLGSAVGSILARMCMPTQGSNSQIICVTHLPQVACFAAHHVKVQKELPLPPITSAGAGGDAVATGGGASPRVTTSFVPLTSFGSRCEEVAAMLGLDRGVAEDMLYSAQSQVAAMYPPGATPEGLLQQLQQRHQQQQGAGVAGGGISTSDDGNLRAASVRRAVQDTLRGGGGGAEDGEPGRVSTAFSVVVSPTMDPNAVLIGGDQNGDDYDAAAGSSEARHSGISYHSGARGFTGEGVGWGEGQDGESEADEAELSAQLLAGVEAAAMQHLQRMEAQAKAAAAAAAAAAVIVAPAEAGGAPPPPPVPPQASSAISAMEAAECGVPAAQESTAAGGAALAPAIPLETATTPDPMPGVGAWGAQGDEGVDETWPGLGLNGVTGPEARVQADDEFVHSVAETTSAPSDLLAAPPSDLLAAPSTSGTGLLVPESGSVLVGSAGGAPMYSDGGHVEVDVAAEAAAGVESPLSGAGCGFVVAVQPTRSPLPYNFSGEDDAAADDGGSNDDPSTAASELVTGFANETRNGQIWNDHGSSYDMFYVDHPSQQQQSHQNDAAAADVAAPPYTAAALQTNGNTVAGDNRYTYDLSGDGGGRFVMVPSGQENEFKEMFQTIMSFSREDYAGEAMRSHEATLWEALRSAGLT